MKSAIILCGGKATRMGTICEKVPKILMRVGEKTILEHQIDLLMQANVERVILAVGHLMDAIKQEVGDDYRGIDVIYSEETEPLGTAGAFKNAFKYLDKDEMCFGLNGDIFMPDFKSNVFERTATVNPNIDIYVTTFEWIPPYGIVRGANGQNFGRISEFIEKKPVMVNAGFYIITPRARSLFPDKGSIEHDVFENNSKCGYYLYNGAWFDCGTPKNLEDANNYLK